MRILLKSSTAGLFSRPEHLRVVVKTVEPRAANGRAGIYQRVLWPGPQHKIRILGIVGQLFEEAVIGVRFIEI